MKRSIKKSLCFVLAAVMLLSFAGVFAYALENDISRVVCTMYKDGAYGRGFSWFTEEFSGSEVQIVKTADFDGSFSNAKTFSGTVSFYRGRFSHKVSVTSLESGTAYTYRVGDSSKDIWSECGSFVTDNADESFSFITIADVQASSKENFQQAYKTIEAAYETMPNAEFSVNLGDYVNDNTNDEWDWYFDSFDGINSILTHVPVAGNHDGNITNKLNTFCFKNMFCLDESANQSLEGVYYSFDYGNAHIAVLNTNDMYPTSQAQINWLKNDMSASKATWKILFCHRSFYSAGKNINKPDTLIMREVLLPVIDELGIDIVYAGHDHMYLRTSPVYGDKKTETVFVEESFSGENTAFALDPKGTVYTLPSTAGTKRYAVNENAIEPILSVADKAFSTKELGGCFCTTQIDSDKLVYKAYAVNDETGEITLIDEYAIKKTVPKECIEPTQLDESLQTSIACEPSNLIDALSGMLLSYIRLLWSVIRNS